MATFKTRARTLDMLGRQQIAGIPTAISELFKNAHDAYADHVEVDYYRSDGLFVLRDDGIGMTGRDFEDRWLTLGTESKLGIGTGLTPPPSKDNRPILGEKGIGRLAIASIGPQVLALTRANDVNGKSELVSAFINWTLFELPGIDLNQITIPIRIFQDDKFITKIDLIDMINEVKNNLDNLEKNNEIKPYDSERLKKQLESFDIDPQEVDGYLERLSLTKGKTGTHFYIKPAYDLLQTAIDGDKNDDRASPLLKSLIGFTNSVVNNNKSYIDAKFRDHKTDNYYDELISDAFFTSDEFDQADHHFKGTFDEFGQFNGTVSIYGENTEKHNIYWKEGYGQATSCGPFSIDIAYVQGSPTQSRLPPEEHALMLAKLNKMGGLYIYKDGIRILPYGDSDYDFLDIEKRRTYGADYYFFSYRRMIGFISITRERNPNLIEKAGREGFIQNKAYKQFRNILENFFIQLAADFFRPRHKGGGIRVELFDRKRKELVQLNKAKEEAEKKASAKKIKLQADLEKFFRSINQNEPHKDIQDLLTRLKREFQIASEKQDMDEACQAVLDAESYGRKELEQIKNKYRVIKPRGFAPGKTLKLDWNRYIDEYERLEIDIFNLASSEIEQIANETIVKHNLLVDKRRRLQRSLDDTLDNAKNTTKMETSETKAIMNDVQSNIVNLTKNILMETEDEISATLSKFAKLDVSKFDDTTLVSESIELEKPIVEKVEKNKELLESVQAQLKNIVTVNENGDIIPSSLDITQAYEDELLSLRDRAEIELELSQLGMAISVVQHEFVITIKSLRDNLRNLKSWADVNEGLHPLYKNIRDNFEHLDGYLTLFTPLNRRLYRNKIDITGIDIKDFIDELFENRIERHNITIESTNRFNNSITFGYPSTFYPVFVNIIDNAIFWLKDIPILPDHPASRKILLDADDKGLTISNNGPEIPIQDQEIIFEAGFTRKPNGRGLGLYISRQVLSREGYRIFVDGTVPGMNVTFRIEPIKNTI